MSHSEARAARKPSRLGLWAPFAFAVLLVLAWSGAWLWLERETEQRLDGAVAALRADGDAVAWGRLRVGGYPFRLDLDFDNLRLAEPSGWALAAAQLKTEAYAWAPMRWILVAPRGIAFARPGGGAVRVGALVLRASMEDWSASPPHLVVEGKEVTFAPMAGGRWFPVSSAAKLVLATRAGPRDQGAIYLKLDQARGRLADLLAGVAERGPFTLTANLVFNHASAARGRDWPALVRAWSRAGGSLQVVQLSLATGESRLGARAGAFTVGADGQVSGRLEASLGSAPAPTVSSRTAAAEGPARHVVIDFQDGRTRLGPVIVGPAPRLF
ncbi:MAG TPA: DUF2125 domain-containing protein [Caulobacteraceae bacterium]|nr:DUF2125 domain-containing protein [Caulobacteraceae bacterium]